VSDGQVGPWQTAAAPGRRVPHRWLEPGSSTLDLVDLDHVALTAPDTDVTELCAEAAARGMPIVVHRLAPDVMAGLGADWVVVRPDHVVAATGTGSPPTRRLVDVLSGHAGPTST
jgi:hypothetical protein